MHAEVACCVRCAQEDEAVQPLLQPVNEKHEGNSRVADVLTSICGALGIDCPALQSGGGGSSGNAEAADDAEDMEDDGDGSADEDDDEDLAYDMAEDDDTDLTVISAPHLQNLLLAQVNRPSWFVCWPVDRNSRMFPDENLWLHMHADVHPAEADPVDCGRGDAQPQGGFG